MMGQFEIPYHRSSISLVSELPPELVEKIHLLPIKDPQSAINQWIEDNPQVSIGIVTDGNKLAVYKKRN